MKNGKLLAAAEGNFDVLVTIDKNIANQTNFRQRKISVLAVRTASSDLVDILAHLPAARGRFAAHRAGEIIYVGSGVG